jgi:hypothetical protein
MHYSIAHDWQNNPAVKQILVFPDIHDKDDFERDYLKTDRDFPYTDSQFEDIKAKGVFVKFRAVLNGNDKWIPIIRTADGTSIKEFKTHFEIWEDAIIYARNQLKNILG